MKEFLLVGLGGALGSMLRYGVTLATAAMALSSWVGTMFVNVVGAFVIGFVMSFCEKGSLNLLLTVGLCGGFTTFSTFSSQTLAMLQGGKYGLFACYVLFTLLLCLLFVWAGVLVGNLLKK